jgi:hypothetical protein
MNTGHNGNKVWKAGLCGALSSSTMLDDDAIAEGL